MRVNLVIPGEIACGEHACERSDLSRLGRCSRSKKKNGRPSSGRPPCFQRMLVEQTRATSRDVYFGGAFEPPAGPLPPLVTGVAGERSRWRKLTELVSNEIFSARLHLQV